MIVVPQPKNSLEEIIKGDYSLTAQEIIPLISKYQLLPRLIGELIIDRAIASISLTKDAIDENYRQFCQQQQITSDLQLEAWLKARCLSPTQLQDLLVRKLKIAKFKQARWGQQLDSYFHQRKSQLDRVIYSLIQVSDENLALELYFRLREGETSFADLARKYSEGRQAEIGGLIGPVELSTCPRNLAKLFSVGQAEQIYPPQPLGKSIVIIKLGQYISAQLDNRMRQRLLDELFATWLQQRIARQSVARVTCG